MTKEEIIKLGKRLGLSFDEKTNYKDALENGIVIFDGCNGQRFRVESSWSDDDIYKTIGYSLILQGKREKSLEIHRIMSINDDYC